LAVRFAEPISLAVITPRQKVGNAISLAATPLVPRTSDAPRVTRLPVTWAAKQALKREKAGSVDVAGRQAKHDRRVGDRGIVRISPPSPDSRHR
jgi:hypothetical protein